jgi:hypothetical protein
MRPFKTVLVASTLALTLGTAGGAFAQTTPEATPGTAAAGSADLAALKDYMVGNGDQMAAGVTELLDFAQGYYDLAESVDFDYQALWDQHGAEIQPQLEAARVAWSEEAHGHYELNEGLVAGIPSLAYYDVLIDAGPTGEDDPTNALDNSIDLPDGSTLERPGNLFHAVTEPTLWGTLDQYTGLAIDMDGDGTIELGEALPDANVLLGSMQALDTATTELVGAIAAWEPTLDDTFTALVVMIPTMQGYFNDWKLSPAVLGDASEESGFVANSRLVDVLGILGGLDVAYDIVQPQIAAVDPDVATQIRTSLDDMVTFVQDIRDQEEAGMVFTPEQADLFGTQLQAQADDVAGQIAQAATLVGATIQTV